MVKSRRSCLEIRQKDIEIALDVVVESETRIIEDTDDIYFDYRVVIFTKETSFTGLAFVMEPAFVKSLKLFFLSFSYGPAPQH